MWYIPAAHVCLTPTETGETVLGLRIDLGRIDMRGHAAYRLACATAIATAAFIATASSAKASPPTRIPSNPPVTWPAGTVCPYPVRVVATQDKSLLHELSNGQLLITGKLAQHVTNMRTGVSRTFQVNGPLRIVPNVDGTTTLINHGNILWTFFEGDAGGPGLFIFTGHVVMEVSVDGFATAVSRAPRTQDVCALLA
jgi:hypothetical protein